MRGQANRTPVGGDGSNLVHSIVMMDWMMRPSDRGRQMHQCQGREGEKERLSERWLFTNEGVREAGIRSYPISEWSAEVTLA